jgi:protein AroM
MAPFRSAQSTLGVVTIGQAPRVDLLPEITPHLPPGVQIIEHGALDGMSEADIAALAPRGGETALTSRLASGESAVFSHDQAMPLVQQAVQRSQDDGADVVLVVCSGAFPPLVCHVPLLLAEPLAQHGVAGLANGRRVGIIRPLESQLEEGRRRWQRILNGPFPETRAASPYTGGTEAVAAAAAELADHSDLLVLDCMGYDEAMRSQAAAVSRRPVVLVRSTVARLTAELLQN